MPYRGDRDPSSLITAVDESSPADDALRCEIAAPVTIEEQTGPIAGTLCVPAGATRLQILIPGLTYSREYWDWPFGDRRYSYAAHQNRRGEATLALDRLGTGVSWHPPSAMVTYEAQVSAIAQTIDQIVEHHLVPALRSIVLVGHSFGSVVAYGVATASSVVDALVVTSTGHAPHGIGVLRHAAAVAQPANVESRFSTLDPGYLTPLPGIRAGFYNPANTDPQIIALDEQIKDVSALPESTTAPTFDSAAAVNLPVLLVVGGADPHVCMPPVLALDSSSDAAVAAYERRFFGPRATLQAAVVAKTGHNLNLEFSHAEAWAVIDSFLTALEH
ncbi:alpha/beta hydrolase [Nocardia transvalensis]|uniref:alpha/beta hydrolase n=1 Tax=Nocardia transvalensis TaxID=37333 RepID=UPI0018937F1C|nr:alpha/beta hydrolase [Nocardia transvalensis]MBF6333636.1 alpha/beta hydrolase [Nocardia transvalensis]